MKNIPLTSASFDKLQERYRELNMQFVNKYHTLTPEQYTSMMDELNVLRQVIIDVQPTVGA